MDGFFYQAPPLLDKHFLIGFDGFCDTIIHCVQKRGSHQKVTKIPTIADFIKQIEKAVGKSTNIECLVVQKKLGGNAPILANALTKASPQAQVSLTAALGKAIIDPLFDPLVQACHEVFSLTDPGHTDAFEFSDGKLLFGQMQSILSIDKKLLIEKVGTEKFQEMVETSDLIATVNWTMIPSMNEIWEYMQKKVLKELKVDKKRWLFVDLADPAKREDEDLRKALYLLQKMQPKLNVCISFNEKESERIQHLFKAQNHEPATEERLLQRAQFLHKHTKLDTVVIHSNTHAAIASTKDSCMIEGPFCKKPKLTTGAGDNFNAGLCQALVLDLNGTDTLLFATATSGFYVRYAKSPTHKELFAFIKQWQEGKLKD